MKRTFLTLITIFAITFTALAQATQPCVVKQYNQKQQKTPLAGVQVEVRGAQTATSAANGALSLQFATLKPGDRVPFRAATKAGYELMNKTAVEQWNISRDQKPFEIVLIQSAYFTQLKGKLKQSSVDSYHEKYEKARAELEKLQKEGKLKEQEYYDKLNELEDRYDSQLKNLDAYVDQFARIDLSELSEQEQQFIELAHAGRLDEAAEAYNALNAAGKYITAVENVRKLNEDIAKLEDEKAQQQEAAKSFYAMLQRQVNTLKLAGGEENYKKAGELLKRAALADTTNIDAVWEYAVFAEEQCDFSESEQFYLTYLNNCSDDVSSLNCHLILGQFYNSISKYYKAEEHLLKAQDIYQQLCIESETEQYWLSYIQMMLGRLYSTGRYFSDIYDFAKAEENYLNALEGFSQLYEKDPENNCDKLASLLVDLGDLYNSEHYYLEALALYDDYYVTTPDSNDSFKGYVYFKLGKLNDGYAMDSKDEYYQPTDSTVYYGMKAEEYYLQAIEIFSRLYSQNPNANRYELARTEGFLGDVYFSYLENLEKAEEYYLKALDDLSNNSPHMSEQYLGELNTLQHDLYRCYDEIGDNDKSEEYLLMYLETWTLLFMMNPDEYGETYLFKQDDVIRYYEDELKDFTKAEKYYLIKLESCKELFGREPPKYAGYLVSIYLHLCEFYLFKLNDTVKAEECCFHALDALQPLQEQDPDAYLTCLAYIQLNIGGLYTYLHNYVKAEEYYLKALENYTQLFTQNPEDFRAYLASTYNGLAYLYAYQKNYTQAVENIDRALALRPEKESYYASKIEFQLKKGDEQEAEKTWQKAKEFDIGISQMEISDTTILESLDRLLSRNPEEYRADLADIQHSLGLLYDDLHDYAKSEEYYLKALENRTQLFRQNPDAYRADLAMIQYNLGILYSNLQNYAKAEEYYLKALENKTLLFAQNPDTYCVDLAMIQNNLGNLYRTIHDYAKAEDYYLKALENLTQLFTQNVVYRSNLADTQHNLGLLYYNLHDYAKAEEYYLKALENRTQLFRQNPDAYRASLTGSYNQLAYLYAHQNNFTKALETIDKAIELMSEDAGYYDTKGEILLMKGDEQEAVKIWQKVLELDPDFLMKYEGGTDFYKQLKEKGLLDN